MKNYSIYGRIQITDKAKFEAIISIETIKNIPHKIHSTHIMALNSGDVFKEIKRFFDRVTKEEE